MSDNRIKELFRSVGGSAGVAAVVDKTPHLLLRGASDAEIRVAAYGGTVAENILSAFFLAKNWDAPVTYEPGDSDSYILGTEPIVIDPAEGKTVTAFVANLQARGITI